jgi:hypothetical protein
VQRWHRLTQLDAAAHGVDRAGRGKAAALTIGTLAALPASMRYFRYQSLPLALLFVACGGASPSADGGANEMSYAPAETPTPDLAISPEGAVPGSGPGSSVGGVTPTSGAADTVASEPAASGPAAAAPGAVAFEPAASGTPSAGVSVVSGESESAAGADLVAAPPVVAPEPTPSEPAPPAPVQSGTLTAGTWDDNQNFARFLDYRSELVDAQMNGLLPVSEDDHVAVQELGMGTPRPHLSLDISLVIDTTGSMSDELSYLQTEFMSLSQSIADTYPEAKQRWSLVVYRDQGDEYVTRSFDFDNDAEQFRSNLAAQSADGGGDFPEAPDQALAVMNQLGWRTSENTARLAFWVADAPHHPGNAEAMANEILTSQGQDIHIYPVASSGVDELTELTMRSAAQLTGGRYVFLTDDSGVGGAHKEPSIPCYFVTRLDDAILRMVDIEMSGEYHEPAADEIIRTGGDPTDGACTLDSGEVVGVF